MLKLSRSSSGLFSIWAIWGSRSISCSTHTSKPTVLVGAHVWHKQASMHPHIAVHTAKALPMGCLSGCPQLQNQPMRLKTNMLRCSLRHAGLYMHNTTGRTCLILAMLAKHQH